MTRLTALLVTVLTGFTGLVYEVTWQKYLAMLVGSHGEATAAVLAIFLGGLSAGYALFGRATRALVERGRRRGHSPRLLLFYALVEGGIGVYALLFPTLFGFARSLSLLAPAGQAGLGFGFDVGLSALLIGPPAVLMGGTIPVLTLALAGDLAHATRVHAWVYGFNTAGAFAGALAAGFFLIPVLGLDGVLYAMGPLNLLAAATFALLDWLGEPAVPELTLPGAGAPVRGFAAYAGVALLAGFAMMAVQTVLVRIGGLAFGASQFTFAMVVAAFVLSIAVGSLTVSALPRIPPGLIVGSQWMLVLLLLLLYYQMPDATYWAHAIRATLNDVDAAFYPFYYLTFTALLALLIVPIGLSGALLPLLFHHLRREAGSLGAVAGRLYSWNTTGSLLGALLGGYVLLFWLDLDDVYRIALAALVLGAATLTVLVLRAPPLLTALLVVLPAVAGLWTTPSWNPERLSAGLFRSRRPTPATFRGADAFFERRKPVEVLFYEDGPTATVSVRESEGKGGRLTRVIVSNGKADGNLFFDYPTMALTALLPALMADTFERSFVIGYGTGVTAGELAALELTREIDVAEIAQGVINAAPLFDMGNLNASTNPKVKIQRGDAYRTLLRSQGQYGLIVSEPSNPWVNGVEMLYSVEFLEAARGRLAPGGVYCQWFHLYEIDVESVNLVLRTYASVFPHVSVWYTMGADLLLLGFEAPGRALDLGAIEARFRRPDFAAGFARVGIDDFPALLAHEVLPLGTLHAARLEGQLHTLRHPILSYRAARAFFRGSLAVMPKFVKPASARIGARNSLLSRYLRGHGRARSEAVLERATHESCRRQRASDCATLLARWKRDYPGSARLRAALAELRSGPGLGATALADEKLAELIAFFDGVALDASAGEDPVERATEITAKFLRHYQYAAPFDRKALSAAWEGCTEPACEKARSQVEARVGRLD